MTEGLIVRRSVHSAKETMERLTSAVAAKGLTIFARIDHAAGAATAGLELRPTELLIFGNARGGTPLMQEQQTIGIDLPLKALVWQDAEGQTWLGYNDPVWLARRHAIDKDPCPAVPALGAALESLARHATERG